MQRRTFFKWIGSSVAPIIAPRWAFSRADPFAAEGNATLRALAAVVLPVSLGRNRIDAITDHFASWLENYVPMRRHRRGRPAQGSTYTACSIAWHTTTTDASSA
jgi:hypothetical protein